MSTQDILSLTTGMIGGLALFMYGMNVMSGALSQLAGGKLEGVIDKVTKTRFSGWLFGVLVTAAVQSSSATTVLTVGLVNSGILKLTQAVNLVIGANLGTTANTWLLSLNSIQGESLLMNLVKPATFCPFLAIIGVGGLMFWKSDRKITTATMIIGFSIMMIGMNMMGSAVTPLKNNDTFRNMLTHFTNPFLGYLFAVLFTMVIQSSDAVVGMLLVFAMSVGITYDIAIPITCGAQVGTCITAILSSLGTNNNGKRTALLHLYYNLMKTFPFLIVFAIAEKLLPLPFFTAEAKAVGIAGFYSLINVAASIILLPVSEMIVSLVLKTIPYNEDEQREMEDSLKILDERFLRDPAYAAAQAERAVEIQAEAVLSAFNAFRVLTMETDPGEAPDGLPAEQVYLLVDKAQKYGRQIGEYLVKISQMKIMDQDARRVAFLQASCSDFTRIGERIQALVGIRENMEKEQLSFSGAGKSDLGLFRDATGEILETVVNDLSIQNARLAGTIQVYREVISNLYAAINNRHIKRMHKGDYDSRLNRLFSEICFEYEKIVDDCDSIAGQLLIYLGGDGLSGDQAFYDKVYSLFQDKYTMMDL